MRPLNNANCSKNYTPHTTFCQSKNSGSWDVSFFETARYGARSLKRDCLDHSLVDDAAGCRAECVSINLYSLVTEAHKPEQLAQGCYAALSRWELNPRPIDRKSNDLPLAKSNLLGVQSSGHVNWYQPYFYRAKQLC